MSSIVTVETTELRFPSRIKAVDEVAAAVGAGDLAVAEHVADRQELFFQKLHAVARVGFAAVVGRK